MSDKHLPGLSLLDTLRPPPGWRVDRALLSTYSAEPAAIAAVLLALAGCDDEEGSGSRVGLARALLELRGRVAIVLQRGRFAAPRRGGAVLRLLDRYIREMPWNEGPNEEGQGRSWHPKCAIVRMTSEGGEAVAWRFHLGSRNLTRDLSWDIGLRIDGQSGGTRGQEVPGLFKLVQRLADAASEQTAWAPFLQQLGSARWDVPRGLAIHDINLMLPEDAGRDLPVAPKGVSELIAVSPFLDGAATASIGAWGNSDTRRSIVSTRIALAGIASQSRKPLKGFQPLLVLPETPDAPELLDTETDQSSEAAVEGRGLHAKFLWAEHGTGATLWLGSANLTMRGWKRNAEIVAEIAVERRGGASAARELSEGISAFRDCGEEVKEEDLGEDVPHEPADLERLEEARREVSARLEARQKMGVGTGIRVVCTMPPHPRDPDIGMAIGPVAGALTEWPREQDSVALVGSSAEAPTELLVIKLALNGQELSWTQIVLFDPPLGTARLDIRDASTLASWLGARGMMAAIRGLLDGSGDGGAGDDKWDSSDDASQPLRRVVRSAVDMEAPSLEQVLKAWMRDPGRLALVERLLRASPVQAIGTSDDAAREKLRAFQQTWTTLAKALAAGSHGA